MLSVSSFWTTYFASSDVQKMVCLCLKGNGALVLVLHSATAMPQPSPSYLIPSKYSEAPLPPGLQMHLVLLFFKRRRAGAFPILGLRSVVVSYSRWALVFESEFLPCDVHVETQDPDGHIRLFACAHMMEVLLQQPSQCLTPPPRSDRPSSTIRCQGW